MVSLFWSIYCSLSIKEIKKNNVMITIPLHPKSNLTRVSKKYPLLQPRNCQKKIQEHFCPTKLIKMPFVGSLVSLKILNLLFVVFSSHNYIYG